MADDEVKVTGQRQVPPSRKYPGLSPLEAGLTYGGAASTVMGPLGLLIGLGSGIVAKRMKKSWLDREARYNQMLANEHEDFSSEVNREIEIADPDEKRLLNHARRLEAEGWDRLMAGDETGRGMVEKANELARGIMNADIQARKQDQLSAMQMQRTLIQNSATAYRDEYQKNLSQFEDINAQADKVLKLAADANFDPNKPFNKAVMTDLLTVGVGGLYRDAPDVLGAIPIVGEFLERGADAWTGKFELTREDYNRVALSMKQANEQVAGQRMQRLGDQAQKLDGFAQQSGATPQGYSLREYVTGDVDELQLTPVPKQQPTGKLGTKQLPGLQGEVSGPTGLFSDSPMGKRIESWVNKQVGPKKRPTN